MFNFIYALSVTPFEQEMLGARANDFNYVGSQDYPVHLLYCENTRKVIECGNPVQRASNEFIPRFFEALDKMGALYTIKYRILCSEEQSEKSLVEQIA